MLNGKHNPRLDLYVSKTPGYLLKLNFSDCPLLMRNGKISEILNKHSDMSAEILKMIPKAIEDPVLVLKSKTNPANSVVIITDILTSKGEMIVPVWANQSGNYIDLDLGDVSLNANFVASAYGRNTENLIKYAVNHNGVLYQNSDTKRVIQLLARNGLQLPTPLKLSDSIINVSEKGAAVNSKLQNSKEIIERINTGNDDLRYSEEIPYDKQIDSVVDGTKSYQLEQASEVQYSEETDSDSSAKTAAKLKKEIANDIQRRIKQRRNYGQVYGFNAEDYKASGKSDFGRAILRSGTKGFGDISQFEVRDGVYTKDEGSVSVRVQGLKFSEETDSDSSAKTAAKLKKEIEKATRLPCGSLVAFFI